MEFRIFLGIHSAKFWCSSVIQGFVLTAVMVGEGVVIDLRVRVVVKTGIVVVKVDNKSASTSALTLLLVSLLAIPPISG